MDPNPAVCNKQGALPTAVTKWAYYTVQEVKNKTRQNRGMEKGDDCLVMMLP